MAKVKFSTIVSEIRNKLNGSVFARNRGGSYIRTKVTPNNPQTAAQVQARILLTQFSQSWRTLTQAQQEAWNAQVVNWQTTDVFGDLLKPSGINLYVRLNINISIAGGSALSVPPTPAGAPAVFSATVSAAAGAGTVTVATVPANVPADTALVIRATPMTSPGVSNANAQLRVVQVFAPAASGPHDIAAAYIAKFGALVAGQKLFVTAQHINQLTGEKSQAARSEIIVSA